MPKWSYGILCSQKRKGTLLPRTLESLDEAGWTIPRLFVDGAECDKGWSDLSLDVTFRYPKVGVSANWMLSALELYTRTPDADLFALFQDDLVCCKNLRPYLDASGCPRNAYLTLYSPPSYCELLKRSGWQPGPSITEGQQFGRGALALIFSNQAMCEVLSSLFIIERFREEPTRGWKGIDQAIVVSMNRSGYSEWAHIPSLVQHTGRESTIDKRHGEKFKPLEDPPPFIHQERWQSPCFVGENFDALTLLEKNHEQTTR